MSRLVLSAIALALGLLPIGADPAFAERRIALVIGNSAYQNVPALPNPQRDAQAMADMFLKAGFDVVSAQYNVGNLQFKRVIQLFEDKAADSDIAVVYYSGHGIEIQGINYLIPVDAKLASDRDVEGEAITLERLAKSVDRAKRLRLVILDASRDNPFRRTMKQQRTAAPRVSSPGLAEVEPSANTLIAYAAKANTEAEDGNAEHSPYANALLHSLFVRGLDIRFAFGRVREEVLKKTGNRQAPFVYGSLRGGNISLVRAPDQLAVDLEGEKSDYGLVEKLGTKRAWEAFLVQHPAGFYSGLARQQIAKLRLAEAEPPTAHGLSTEEQQQTQLEEAKRHAKAAPATQETACKNEEDRLTSLQAAGGNTRDDLKRLEQELTCQRLRPLVIAALERANTIPDINAPELVRSAQQELNRLGCFSGAVDGSLNAPTKAAVLRYLDDRGSKPATDVIITDEFVTELKKQSARVCPLVCPAGRIAEGEQCIDAKKTKAIARRKGEDATSAKRNQANQEERPGRRHETPPRVTEKASHGGHASTDIGVGF